MKYFAYGSNMSVRRLQQRVPSATMLGVYPLAGHCLCFHKMGYDGSAKCDAYYTGHQTEQIFGVLFDIVATEKPYLDLVEGLGQGYEEKLICLVDEDGIEIEAFTYYATAIDKTVQPYSWYLNHVLVGAREANLPDFYVAGIMAQSTIEDPDQRRDQQERKIYQVVRDLAAKE